MDAHILLKTVLINQPPNFLTTFGTRTAQDKPQHTKSQINMIQLGVVSPNIGVFGTYQTWIQNLK